MKLSEAIEKTRNFVPYRDMDVAFPDYSEYRGFEISGIPGVVADPHNETFPVVRRKSLEYGLPFVEFLVDGHTDMQDGCMSFSAFRHAFPGFDHEDYALRAVGIDNFHIAQRALNVIGPVYHLDPRYPFRIQAFGRVTDGKFTGMPAFGESDGMLSWAGGKAGAKVIRVEEMKNDLRNYKGPFLVNTDLDAYWGIGEKLLLPDETRGKIGIGPIPEEYVTNTVATRLGLVSEVLGSLPEPDLLAIARSQTPISFIPQNEIQTDILQRDVIDMLDRVYSLRRNR